MNKFVVIDLETTGNSIENKDKIIEVGIVIIEDDQIVDEYSTLLQPNKKIPPFITNLTGITNKEVEYAPHFEAVAKDIVELFEDSYLVAHNVPFDLGFLNYELSESGALELSNPVIDTVELTRILYPNAPSYKLGQLAEYFGLSHRDPHRALSDAYVTAKLLLKLKNKLHQLPIETIHHLLSLEKNLKSDLKLILQKRVNEINKVTKVTNSNNYISFGGLAFRKVSDNHLERGTIIDSYGDYLDSIYEENGAMDQVINQYEKREGQREMSETIFHAFQQKQHALIEAETGTGKSLAYLIPAIYEALKTNKRIVISTYTTHLQTQLLEEEIPQARRLMDYPFSAVILKGKQHYISLEKFAFEMTQNEQDNYDITLTKAMLVVWLTETETGDIDEVQLPSSGYLFFKQISSEAEAEVNPKSPWFSYSFYQRAKQQAQQADIIITNHALLCTDLFHDYEILPKYKKAIIDEAHHLEETISSRYGLKLDYVTIQHNLNHLGKTNYKNDDIEEWLTLFTDVKHEVDDLFRTLYQYVLHKCKQSPSYSDTGRLQYRLNPKVDDDKRWSVIKDMAQRVIASLENMIHYLSHVDNDLMEEHHIDENAGKIDVLNTYSKTLYQLLIENSDFVRWAEIDAFGAKNAVYLYSEPMDISDLLYEDFFTKKESIVLTSATMTMKNSFSFIMDRLGLPKDEVVCKQIQTTFSYENQVKVLVPNDFPEISHHTMDEFTVATCEAIISLAKITKGRMLVLFTSYDMLKRAYSILRESLDLDQYILIAQGISSGSRSRLKKNFQTFNQAILLGTSSFWEGVDIPGEDLSSLVIVRLPFQVPTHPVYEAKSKYLKELGKNPFMDLALPNAVIRFKQGFGRLIRSKSDRGVVFICDARLIKARYGTYFTGSMPDVTLHYDTTNKLMQLAEKWF